jgi:hypothetical protein
MANGPVSCPLGRSGSVVGVYDEAGAQVIDYRPAGETT